MPVPFFHFDWFDPKKEHKALKSAVNDFMRASRAAQIENHSSVGLGTDLCLESKKVTGFALLLDDKILHLLHFHPDQWPGTKKPPIREGKI